MTGRLITSLVFLIGVNFPLGSQAIAARVMKVDRSEGKVGVQLNRRERQNLRPKARIRLVLPRSGQELTGLVQALRRQKAIIQIRKGDRIPLRLRKRSSVKIRTYGKSRRVASLGPTQRFRAKKSSTTLFKYVPGGSEIDRTGKSLSLDLEAGTSVAPFPSAGGTLGFFINRNTAFEINFARGQGTGENVDIANNLITVQPAITTDVAVMRFKTFLGNSFYTNAGIGGRQVTVTANPVLVAEGFPLNSGPLFQKARADAIFDFGIGNKWQFSYFNIGFDWIGLMAPLSKIRLPNDGRSQAIDSEVLASYVPGTDVSDEDLNPDQFEQLNDTTFYSRFYLGFSF